MATTLPEHAIQAALSLARISTYEIASVRVPQLPIIADALALYAWNARISAALMVPLHICEVVIRNAVAEALERVYGPGWPWSPGFQRSLPVPAFGYNPNQDLFSVARRFATTGKVIPELKFIFWQTMFTSRFDKRLWEPHLRIILPNMDGSKTVSQLRSTVFSDLDVLRLLRNRIAHHEPVFNRDLSDDLMKINELIGFRCSVTAAWMRAQEQASEVLAAKPWLHT